MARASRAASRVSPRPRRKPLSRSRRTNPTIRRTTGTPSSRSGKATTALIGSPELGRQALGHVGGHGLAILVGLEQAEQGGVQRLGVVAEVPGAEPDQGRGPVEGLRDSRPLAQILAGPPFG